MKIKGIYFLYRILQAFGLPVLLLYFLLRGLKNRGYWRSLPQRFGFLPRSLRQTVPGAIWLHAVSVGEVIACVEFLRKLRDAFPHTAILVSTGTLAGRATAEEKLRGLANGIFFAPIDSVFAVRRVIRQIRPSLVLIAETEIWPNLFREVHRTGAGLAIVNGRISDKAFPSYKAWAWFWRSVLSHADAILAQTEAIRERFVVIGAPSERVKVAGNFKYDFEAKAAPSESPAVAWIAAWIAARRPAKVWIAASTMGPARAGDVDEDDAVLAAFAGIPRNHLVLVLAPRKPERFDVAAKKLEAAGIPFARRTNLATSTGAGRVLLLDTIGELSGLFALADVVFMGGTLADRGGHNILEPAFFGKPVIVGPHMENFQAIAGDFRAANACVSIAAPAELSAAVTRLLDEPAAAAEIGRAALASASARRGATARAVAEARELYRIPRLRPAQPANAIRKALSRIWAYGGRRRRAAAEFDQRRVDAPVISVGNLTMGGTGKTPCVLRIAELLKARGYRPGILTRGYGRSSVEKTLYLPAGATIAAEQTGDEPQIFLRSGLAPVGIGADRYRTGMDLRNDFDVNVLVLDDGYQHVRLYRDADLLLVDALNPFGGCELFPLGRLREPLSGIARANIVVITRSEFSDMACTIEREIRKWNRDAPIFRAWIEPRVWVEHATGREFPAASPPFEKAGMFCGLGNPQSFVHTLRQIGVEPVDCVTFGDHHRYRPRELKHLAHQLQVAGAAALVTTEKDAVNLCDQAAHLVAPLPLYWLKIAMKFDREDEFLALIEKRIRS